MCPNELIREYREYEKEAALQTELRELATDDDTRILCGIMADINSEAAVNAKLNQMGEV